MTRRLAYIRLALLLGACWLSTGCALNRNLPISHLYTLSAQLDDLAPNKLVYKAATAPGFTLADYETLVIPPVELRVAAKHQVFASSVAEEFRQELAAQLKLIFPEKEVLLQSEAGPAGSLTVRLAFAEFTPGNGFVRWFIGTGVGSAELQIEGRGMDPGAEAPKFQFVRKRSYDGHPWGGFNFKLISTRWGARQLAKELARDVASYLGSL